MAEVVEVRTGITVLKRQNGPVPVLSFAIPADPLSGPFMFLMMRKTLHPGKYKKWRGYRFDHPVWHTNKIHVAFVHRDGVLYTNVTTDGFPPRLLWDSATADVSTQIWVDWKAAYQTSKFFLLAYSRFVPPDLFDLHLDDYPVFLIEDLYFQEFGDIRGFERATQEARKAFRRGEHPRSRSFSC